MLRSDLSQPRSHLPAGFLVWALLFCLAGVRGACSADAPSEEGEPFAQYFSPRDYHGGTQCLCMTQDASGVMYIGSLGRVLEYDGAAWRMVDIDSNWVAGIAYEAKTDTVFVGAQNNLGCLQRQPGGERKFVSLLDQLPADARDVGSVRGVYVAADGVYFVGTNRVMRWRDGHFKTWEVAAASKLESSLASGELYVSSPEAGLLQMRADALVPATEDALFCRASVCSVLSAADGAAVIATGDDGLFELKNHAVRPLACECNDFLKRVGIAKALRLRDGSLAIATRTAGLLVLDPARRFRSRLDENSELHGKAIFDLFEDAEGGLWISLQTGVMRAEVDSPFTVLRAGRDDDMASAYCYGRWAGTGVLGSHAGIHRLVAADPVRAVGAHLELVPGTPDSMTALCSVESGLLTITEGKIFLLDAGARLVPVADEISEATDLCASLVHPGRVYAVDQKGRISRLRLDGPTQRWVYDGVAADLGAKGGTYSLGESPRGDLWIWATEHGLYRAEFAADGPAQVTSFFDRPGPLQGDRNLEICGGQGSPLRIKGSSKFCGLDASGRELRVLTEFGPKFCDGFYYLTEAAAYDETSLWLTASDLRDPLGPGMRGRAVAGGPGRAPVFQPLPHKIDEIIGRPTIYYPTDTPPAPLTTMLLVGTTGNGVVRMDVSQWDALPPRRPYTTLIRRASIVAGNPSAAPSPILKAPLPYAQNSVHFEFSPGTLALGADARFQKRLVNFGAGNWSDFSEGNSVDYLNLPEGGYVFEVRARNSDGQLGGVASLPFRVLPPWQRMPLAYVLYALALGAALAAYIQWRGRQLLRRNSALETLVEARTGELRGRESELVRARDDAESSNRAKSAFLANMSHELRTPLNAVLGYTQLLLKQTDLSPGSRERITVIGQSGGHLLSLVNEVLDLAKVEAGKLALSQFEFSLPGLLDEAAAAFRPRLAEKGLTLTENRAADLPPVVRTDPSRLRQVLFNLLSNATKFTIRGGVTLTVRPTDAGRVRFEVADTGVGIAPADLRDIFVAFHQAGGSSLASQGTGLGLTISQRLVELLGGRIEVESAPGEGSRFWFDLQLPAVEPVHGLPSPPARDPALGKVTGYEGGTRRLLLVDDLAENRRILRDFLQPLGFEIEEAADGAACLAACTHQVPDAVLLDLRLGTPDGFEVARTLRARTEGAGPGIIAISASVFESDRQQAIDAGCDDFLPKPFEEAQLLASLGRVLGLRWVQEKPAVPETAAAVAPAAGGATLPASEVYLLRELSLRGDVAGIRRRLDVWRAAGVPGQAGEIVRRLDGLVANYDMEGIHDLLLTVDDHGRD